MATVADYVEPTTEAEIKSLYTLAQRWWRLNMDGDT